MLRGAANEQDQDIAASMAITPKKVSRWRKRFLALGVEGLKKDAPRPGHKPEIGTRLIQRQTNAQRNQMRSTKPVLLDLRTEPLSQTGHSGALLAKVRSIEIDHPPLSKYEEGGKSPRMDRRRCVLLIS